MELLVSRASVRMRGSHSTIHSRRFLPVCVGRLVHMRTAQNDFVVVGCRRKYIPPDGNKYQNVWLKYKGPPVTEGNPIANVEYMVDSLGPSVSVSYYDMLAIKIKTNLLQLDEEMYTFMFNRLNIEPELDDMHIRFYKGVT